jgi:hypothetical protein
VSTGSGLLYVAMQPEGYRVRSAESVLLDNDSNQLSFAATSSGRDLWVETLSKGSPQLVQISPAASCRIDNAETPALSGEATLAFVREDNGRGSLWTFDLHRCGNLDNAAAVRLTAPGFDVRTVSPAAHDALLISAVYQHREAVFTVVPGKSPQLLAESDGPLDSPALSPDGRMLAVRELISGRWQLKLVDLSSSTWEQLTRGDCNAYTPSWEGNSILFYATDCMRGLGLTALTSVELDR